jgi:hypothetical protein
LGSEWIVPALPVDAFLPIKYVGDDLNELRYLDPSYGAEIMVGLAMPISLIAILALRAARRAKAARRTPGKEMESE